MSAAANWSVDQHLIYVKHACNFSCVFIDNKHASASTLIRMPVIVIVCRPMFFFFLCAKFYKKKTWNNSNETIFNSYANATDSKALDNNEKQTVVTIVALKMRNFFLLPSFVLLQFTRVVFDGASFFSGWKSHLQTFTQRIFPFCVIQNVWYERKKKTHRQRHRTREVGGVVEEKCLN